MDKTRLSGYVSIFNKNNAKPTYLTNTVVNIIGMKSNYSATTDSSGYFQLWDVAYDDYRFEPIVAPEYTLTDYSSYGKGYIRILRREAGSDSFAFTLNIEPGPARCGRIDTTFSITK